MSVCWLGSTGERWRIMNSFCEEFWCRQCSFRKSRTLLTSLAVAHHWKIWAIVIQVDVIGKERTPAIKCHGRQNAYIDSEE